MSPEQFFELFLKELEQREDMYHYYKFLKGDRSFNFRKNYFLERLRYIAKHCNDSQQTIWDCGSGYGTTCLFLAMNGIKAHGTTLEFYYDKIPPRYEYWNQFGDATLFTTSYENLFDNQPAPSSYDTIIVQDTLHHLEPIDDALAIFHRTLKPNGKLLCIEENGNNIIQRLKLYKYRGNKRIISIYDETLKKNILIGNENIRSLKHWKQLFEAQNLNIDDSSVDYIRYYLPIKYNEQNAEQLLVKERALQRSNAFLKEYFFFGINFIATKAPQKKH
jgi:SAM-dependent methyltransferase